MGKRQRLRGTSPWGRGEWLYLAACNSKHLDPAWWFDDDPAGVAKALRVCRRCPVRPACLDHALDNREMVGIWGGMTARQRLRIMKERLAPSG